MKKVTPDFYKIFLIIQFAQIRMYLYSDLFYQVDPILHMRK